MAQLCPWTNCVNSRFGPQTFASDSNSSLADSQIPLLPFSNPYALFAASCWGTRCSLCSSLSLSSPRRPTPPIWRPAAPPNPPRRHLLLRRRARILGATAAEAGHGWGVGALGKGGDLQLWFASSERCVGIGEGLTGYLAIGQGWIWAGCESLSTKMTIFVVQGWNWAGCESLRTKTTIFVV
jgi:hypothetical protein